MVRPTQLASVLVLALFSSAVLGSASRPEQGPAALSGSSIATLFRGALPSIVLVGTKLDGDKLRFGAGFFDAAGRVVTARHVIAQRRSVSILPLKEGRASYSPMDGGIGRFLFENTPELVPARVLEVDGVSDLALLEVSSEIGPRRALSAGVVGALQDGIIQRDAAVGPGSSGGPPELGAEGLSEWKRDPKDRSLQADFRDPRRMRDRLRLGLRVEDSRRVAPDMEWVLLGSPNKDGSVSHFSELYVRVHGHGGQRGLPWPDDVAKLLRGWPSPPERFELQRKFSLAALIKRARSGGACSTESPQPGPEAEPRPAVVPAAPSPPRGA